MNLLTSLLLASCVAGLAPAVASGQVTTADLVGTVRDTSGSIVPGVTVTVTNEATGVARVATTGDSGTYSFTALPPGLYRLSVELTGFRKVERTGVELQVNQRAQIDLELSVGLVSETVTIEGGPPLLETQSSVLGTVIQERQVQELPLNGRNFVQLATLTPGVSGAGSGMRGTIMSGTRPDDLRPGTELFVNGNRENANNYLYDGIDNNTRLTLVIVMRPNVEAIKEFKVQTNLYSAEQGRNPGGQINVVTKSGSNAFDGRGLRLPAQRQARREQLLRQSRRAAQAAVRAVPVRRRRRRSDRQEPHVLLRRLRWLQAGRRPGVRDDGADREDAAGRFQRGRHHLRSADDGRPARRDVHAPAVPRQRHSGRPLGSGHGEVDQCLSPADQPGAGQQPRDDADPDAGLESVRRPHRSHAQLERLAARPLFALEDLDGQPVHVSPGAARRPVEAGRTGQRGHVRRTVGPARRARGGRLVARLLAPAAARLALRLQPLQSRVHASRRGDRRAARRAARRAQRQPAGRAGRHSDLQPHRLYRHRAQPFAAHPSPGTHLPVRHEPDVCRRSAHVQGGVRRPPSPHGGVPDEPRQRPLQLHLEHHQQPGQQHRRSRDGVVPAGRAEPHRAGLPPGRRRDQGDRVERLLLRRLARQLEADAEPGTAIRARHAGDRDLEQLGELRCGDGDGADRRAQRRERHGRHPHLQEDVRAACRLRVSPDAGDRGARRRRSLLEHPRARRQRLPPASARPVRPHLQLQPRQPVRQPPRQRRLSDHPAARRDAGRQSERQRDRRRSELPSGLRAAVQSDGRTRAARVAAAQDLVRGQPRPASRHDATT